MATATSLSLVSSDGTPFVLDVDKVVYATDDSNSKAILTYETGEGTNLNVTLSVSTATLQGYATQALVILSTIPLQGGGAVNVCYNNSRVIKVSTWNAITKILYSANLSEVAEEKVINDTASNVNTAVATTIALTDNATSTVFYANPSYFESISEITSASSTNKSLTSATLAGAGTGWIPTETFNFAGGTHTHIATGIVDTTKLISGTVTAAGTAADPTSGLNVAGGTATTTAKMSFNSKFISAPSVNFGGTTGYTTGDHIGLDLDGTGTPAIFSVTANGGGVVTGLSIVFGGVYTVNPTFGTELATTVVTGGGDGTLTVDATIVKMGVNAILQVIPAGSYTVNPTLTNNAVTDGATGATVTIVMGINTFSITDGGAYSVAPSNPVSSTGASASGVGATFTTTFSNSVTKVLFNDKTSAAPYPLLVNETPIEVAALINA